MADRHDEKAAEIVGLWVRFDFDGQIPPSVRTMDALRGRIASALRSEVKPAEERDAALVRRAIEAARTALLSAGQRNREAPSGDRALLILRALAADPEAVRKIIEGGDNG